MSFVLKEDELTYGSGAYTKYNLVQCKGLVIHWIGVTQGHASVIVNNMRSMDTGTQFVSDWYTGEILQAMPETAVAYHVGSNTGYTATKTQICGSNNPNWYLVGIECCTDPSVSIPSDWATQGSHMDLGKPSDVQYDALVSFSADFLKRKGLTSNDLYLHCDITGKLCHVWFTKDESRWTKFKEDVKNKMEDVLEDMTELEMKAIVDKAVTEAIDAYKKSIAPTGKVSSWAKSSWEKAEAQGLMDGTNPDSPLTREQFTTVLGRANLLGSDDIEHTD